ncbi:MAG: 4-demethylwyosine synthase TYW1 [Candidatus Aenigmarchaeota archaeon]|nr:4-demethylwyosine synthase TYW1 [Candidatus Aenigmarchaeota archaeon]
MLTESQLKQLQKANYRMFGKNMHSAVKLCHWCKESIKTGEKRVCYKQKFYGIKSHRCLQMTPCLPICNLGCKYCWRDQSYFTRKWEGDIDKAEEIIEGSIEAQRALLTGLGGVEHDKRCLEEAKDPNQVAISLDGEPTMYPYISDLVNGYNKRGFTTFLVTNGNFPEVLTRFETLPTNLYLSLSSTSEKMFNQLQNLVSMGSWNNVQKTLELFNELKTTRVIRLTLIKGINMIEPEKYAELIKIANPDYIEAKAYMHIGASINRLEFEHMPTHDEVKEFAQKVADYSGYTISNEQKESRVVLLKK